MVALLWKVVCTASSKVEGYAATVDGLPGGPPLAHWCFAEASGTQITDEKAGSRHGTYSGTVIYSAKGLPQNSDNAVNFAGTGTGQVNHDAGLQLAAFTLSFWFSINGLPAEGVQLLLLSKEAAGNNDGDFFAYVTEDGNLRIAFQPGTGPSQEVPPPAEPIEVGATYHLVIRADSSGFDAYLNGKYLGKNTNYVSAWTTNVQPIRFAAAGFTAVLGDMVLDEVALFPRVLSQAEVLALAQQDIIGQNPTAANDTVAVPESATTAINVVSNDTFVGQKANLTVEIVSQPGDGDSVTVNASNDINYTAGAVDENTDRSFTYRIIDANGTSNTATVNVTVTDSEVTAVSNANCYVEDNNDPVRVSSLSELASDFLSASAGTNIVITAGSYRGTVTLNGDGGAEGDAVVIRAEDGIGSVTFNDVTIQINAPYVVFSQVFFNGGTIILNGNHIRVTRCRFRDNNRNYFVEIINGLDCRIDHCEITNPWNTSETGVRRWLRLETDTIVSGTLKRTRVDCNYFHDMTNGGGSNAREIIGPGHAGGTFFDPELVIERNLFENIDLGAGESELYTGKVSGTTLSFNTFVDVPRMQLTCGRTGHFHKVRSNWFEVMKTTGSTPAAVRVNGKGHLIIGNRFIGDGGTSCLLHIAAGNQTFEDQPPSSGDYVRAEDCLIAGNTFTNGAFAQVGGAPSNFEYPALNNTFEGNSPVNPNEVAGEHQGTVVTSTTDEPYVAAIKLTSSDVGLNASDPLC